MLKRSISPAHDSQQTPTAAVSEPPTSSRSNNHPEIIAEISIKSNNNLAKDSKVDHVVVDDDEEEEEDVPLARAQKLISPIFKSKFKPISPEKITQLAVARGLQVEQDSRGFSQGFFDLSKEELKSVGGNEAWLDIFIRAYERFFADPHMLTLFNETSTQRTPEEHGKLLGGFLLMRITYSDSTYVELRHQGIGHGLGGSHWRARNCPARKPEHQGKGFLKSQGYAWLGHVAFAVDDVLENVPRSSNSDLFRKKILTGLYETVFQFYGPWVNDNVSALAQV